MPFYLYEAYSTEQHNRTYLAANGMLLTAFALNQPEELADVTYRLTSALQNAHGRDCYMRTAGPASFRTINDMERWLNIHQRTARMFDVTTSTEDHFAEYESAPWNLGDMLSPFQQEAADQGRAHARMAAASVAYNEETRSRIQQVTDDLDRITARAQMTSLGEEAGAVISELLRGGEEVHVVRPPGIEVAFADGLQIRLTRMPDGLHTLPAPLAEETFVEWCGRIYVEHMAFTTAVPRPGQSAPAAPRPSQQTPTRALRRRIGEDRD